MLFLSSILVFFKLFYQLLREGYYKSTTMIVDLPLFLLILSGLVSYILKLFHYFHIHL